MAKRSTESRVNTTFDPAVRDRIELWRAAQVEATGRIPDLTDAVRVLVHKGLVAEGFSVESKEQSE